MGSTQSPQIPHDTPMPTTAATCLPPLLGTPNGRAGAYLVIDHGEELGIIGIERIEHERRNDEEDMYIYFNEF